MTDQSSPGRLRQHQLILAVAHTHSRSARKSASSSAPAWQFRRLTHRRHPRPLRRDPRLPAIDRHRPRRKNGDRPRWHRARSGHARPRPSLRRISAQEVAFPIRVFGRMGIRAVILTNAAGGINLGYSQGALVVIRDHINLQGANPLVGPNDDRFGVRFPDMTHAYSREYRADRPRRSRQDGIPQHEGVYAGLLGPSYETPAEIEYLRRIGADLVGMSTVAEVIAARHMEMKVLAISCVTNMAAGILDQPLSHTEVMETGERVRSIFESLLKAVLPRVAQST